MGSIGSRDFSPEEVCFWDATSGEAIALPNFQPSLTLFQLVKLVESVRRAIRSNDTEKKRWPGDRSRSLPSVNAFRVGGIIGAGDWGNHGLLDWCRLFSYREALSVFRKVTRSKTVLSHGAERVISSRAPVIIVSSDRVTWVQLSQAFTRSKSPA